MWILVAAGFLVVMALTPPVGGAAAALPWWGVLAAVAAYVAVAYAATRMNAFFSLRRLMRRSSGPRPLGKATRLAAMATQVYLVAALAALMQLGWAEFVSDTLGLRHVPLVGRLVAAAPFVAALLVHWWAVHPLDQAIRMHLRQETAGLGQPILGSWSRRQFVVFNVRHYLLFMAAPLAVIILAADSLDMLQEAGVLSEQAAQALALAVGGGTFLAAPAMVVRIWRTHPLPQGPLRAKLEGLCRRFALKDRRILVWDTGGVIVNAGVMGLIRPVRYVLLTDALLANLDEGGVEAIFAHEAGHVVHRHFQYFIILTVVVLSAFVLAGGLLAAAIAPAPLPPWADLAMLVWAGSAWGVLFGLLSRRFERQADVFAASVASGGQPGQPALTAEGVACFDRALSAVGWLNGMDPRRRSFRHGSIRLRIDYLWRLLNTGTGPKQVNGHIRRIKLALLWAVLAAELAAIALWGILSG